MWFVVILMVFIVAYAIASEAILYPQTELSWKMLYYIPRKAYWHIFGELSLEELEGNHTSFSSSLAPDLKKNRMQDLSHWIPISKGIECKIND
jgi:hypothetical protein